MQRSLLAGLVISAGLLTGCTASGPGNLNVHEVLLYGGTQERLVWVYGTTTGGQSSSFKIGNEVVQLAAQRQDSLGLPGTLSVNGQATYRLPTTLSAPKLALTRQTSGLFSVTPTNPGEVLAVYYTDGQSWTKLSGTSGAVRGTAVRGLQGAGQLTDAEAEALSRVLLGQGRLAVAVLSESGVPDAPLTFEPRPKEYRRTALYILPNVATLGETPTTPLPPTSGANVTFTELASGSQATAGGFSVQLATTQAAAATLYAQAYGRQTGTPAVPTVSADTLVGVFLGQRPTGGYGVRVVGVQASGTTLLLNVQVRAPGAGAITTQALTSPWTIIRVPGKYSQVTVLDEQGRPLQITNPPGSGNER